MDSFDQVRLKASFRSQLVLQTACDPLQPLAVVEAAAKSLELDLIELPSGDPALKGARALYDDQSGTICFEETSAIADRALLIAHELGHAELHAGSASCDPSEIDPSQTSQNSPTGIQRVEDYGAKERRELQANVYARELLLPRSLVAHLYLAQGRNSQDIAEQTGLPLALVRQQLVDALLLPRPEAQPAPAEPVPVPASPDPSQVRAVSHRGSAYQLQAGPGTGKTKTLVARVRSLIEEGIDPAGMLVLTFSNRAAGELYDRLVHSVPAVVDKIWIGTFHSFGLDLIRRFHDRLSLSHDPALFDRSDAIAVLEEQLPTLALKHYRNLWDDLRLRGRNRTRESGAFLLGNVVGGRRRIVGYVLYDDLDPHCLDTGIVRFDGRYFSDLWSHCRKHNVTVVADIHVHPGGAGQSSSDKANPMISMKGHVAFILPNFAAKPCSRRNLGIYQYEGAKQWTTIPGAQRNAFFQIGL